MQGRRDVLYAGEAVRQWGVSDRETHGARGAVSASGAAGGGVQGYVLAMKPAGRSSWLYHLREDRHRYRRRPLAGFVSAIGRE
ncbi:hypothetical protein AS026_11955 [Rhizobium altiplani]|uniref:Uncharacterized protein n=1 Tax=Rhizobium altiplani TaxID=1864509 RepID=A0A120FJ83_9HYPH|nr:MULTISPECIES: hypothetical protein [Rhizobium]KWV48681.1 hypothetical protein AS026_11955 [Rhizobium altiplani]